MASVGLPPRTTVPVEPSWPTAVLLLMRVANVEPLPNVAPLRTSVPGVPPLPGDTVPAMVTLLPTLPVPLNVAPAATVTGPASPAVEASSSVPALTVVDPVYQLLAVSVRVPVPVLVTDPVPTMLLDRVADAEGSMASVPATVMAPVIAEPGCIVRVFVPPVSSTAYPFELAMVPAFVIARSAPFTPEPSDPSGLPLPDPPAPPVMVPELLSVPPLAKTTPAPASPPPRRPAPPAPPAIVPALVSVPRPVKYTPCPPEPGEPGLPLAPPLPPRPPPPPRIVTPAAFV